MTDPRLIPATSVTELLRAAATLHEMIVRVQRDERTDTTLRNVCVVREADVAHLIAAARQALTDAGRPADASALLIAQLDGTLAAGGGL